MLKHTFYNRIGTKKMISEWSKPPSKEPFLFKQAWPRVALMRDTSGAESGGTTGETKGPARLPVSGVCGEKEQED